MAGISGGMGYGSYTGGRYNHIYLAAMGVVQEDMDMGAVLEATAAMAMVVWIRAWEASHLVQNMGEGVIYQALFMAGIHKANLLSTNIKTLVVSLQIQRRQLVLFLGWVRQTRRKGKPRQKSPLKKKWKGLISLVRSLSRPRYNLLRR